MSRVEPIRRLLRGCPPLFRFARAVYRFVNRCYQPLRKRRERALIDRFHKLYYHGSYGEPGHWQGFKWFGVPILKCPMDVCVYQEILFRTRPEIIVETGVQQGGSTLFLAHLCDLMERGRVLACDITLENVYEPVRSHPRVELFEGSSTAPAIVEQICERCRGRRTMVVLDSDHRRDHVAAELECYAPLVSPGCYLICEDTNINGHPVYPDFGPGPHEAVANFLRENPQFEVDADCERLLLTFNPAGYLLRRDDGSQR